MNNLKYIICALIMISLMIIPFTKEEDIQKVEKNAFLLDTFCTLSISNGKNKDFTSIIDEGFAIISEYDKIFDKNNNLSDIYNVNNSNGNSVNISDGSKFLIETSIKYSVETEGLYDITTTNLSEIWNLKEDSFIPPSNEAINELLPFVGYDKIMLEGNDIKLPENCMIDLGSIAKGYIADLVKEHFLENGVTSALINLGGNIYAIGKNGEEKFNIGVQNPFSNDIAGVISVSDLAVVTSGIYQRYKEFEGEIYHHIINPLDGMPVKTDLYSATILSYSTLDADIISTICILLGSDKALSYVENKEGIEAVFIDDEFNIICSSGITEDIFNKL